MYSLSKLINTQGEFKAEVLTKISDQDYALFFKDEALLFQFLIIKNHFDITQLNIEDFSTYIQKISDTLYQEKMLILKEPDFIKLNINRVFLNFIFSFRTYHDHLETFLKREFGDKSSEAIQFKELTSKLYDTHFVYRFFYKLRNYAQHCGIPIEVFEISTSIKDNLYSAKMMIEFDTASLLKKFDDGWGVQVKKELQALGKNLDAVDLTKQFAQVIKEIQKWFYQIIKPKIDPLKAKIQTLTNSTTDAESLCITFENQSGQTCVVDSIFRYIVQLEKYPVT